VTGDQALRELLEVSEDVTAVLLLDSEGTVLAASVEDEAAEQAAPIAAAMLAYADSLRTNTRTRRLEAATGQGHVFLVREGERAVVATTGADPVAGLVLHDLGTALRKVRARAAP
jgi:predicted regulator of Ras-like GTPase activity (Roadblock/LC7/MglB family)